MANKGDMPPKNGDKDMRPMADKGKQPDLTELQKQVAKQAEN